jgi:hypothetical protein
VGQPIEIFCCAAEADRSFLGQLRTQLSLQQQQGIIKLWDESQVPVGAVVDQEIQRHLATTRIFLLLISPDFLANDYCYNRVMKAALERHGRGEAITIPVIVRPAIWQDVRILKHIQVLPRNGQPISGQRDRDYALWEVAKEISMAVQRLGEPRVQPDSGLRPGPYGGMSSPQVGSGPNTGTFPPEPPPFMGYPPVTNGDKISSLPKNAQKKITILLVLAAVVIILAGGISFALYIKGSSNTGSPYAASTQNSSSSFVTPSTGAQNTSTTALTALPTASLSSPKLPLTLPCVSCSYPQLSVALNRIDMDSPAQSTRWFFSFQNNGQHPCSPTFWTVYLTDPSGTNYSGKGQVSEGNSFSIDTGQSVQ